MATTGCAVSDHMEQQLLVSLPTLVSLLLRFHSPLCAPESRIVLERSRSAAVIYCSSCQLSVAQLQDELQLAVRRSCRQLEAVLGLGAGEQQVLLGLLRTEQPDSTSKPTAAPQPSLEECHIVAPAETSQLGLHAVIHAQYPTNAARHRAKPTYRRVRCDVCLKTFYKRSNLRVHMLTHMDLKPHYCEKCGKNFSDPSTLSRHMASVCGDQRPLNCLTCGKTFYHKTHLKEHCRKHTGEKPYVCEKCGRSYVCVSSLRRHLSQHSAGGVPPATSYPCPECNKQFRRIESLQHHRRVHQLPRTGDPPQLSHPSDHEQLLDTSDPPQLSHASDHQQLPHASDHQQLPHASDHQQLPHASDHQQLPHASDHQQLPLAGDSQQLPHASDHQQLPLAGVHQQLPHASDHQQLPLAGDHQQLLGTSDPPQLPHAGDPSAAINSFQPSAHDQHLFDVTSHQMTGHAFMGHSDVLQSMPV